MLFSYYWIEDMHRAKYLAKLKERHPDLSLILDSGAFTYSQQAMRRAVPPPTVFFDRYMAYLQEYGSMWDRVMEFDVDGIEGVQGFDVSPDDVWEMTCRMLDTVPRLNIAPVYHAWRGVEEWGDYLKDPRIKCLAIGRCPPNDGMVMRYVDEAHRLGKTVHGLAWTKYNTSLRYIPFDSVDSSTWISGQKYGNFYVYQNNRILNITTANRGKERVKMYQQYIKARGCDPKKIIAGDRQELLQCNIRTWILISKKLELLRKTQGRNFMEEQGAELTNEMVARPRKAKPHSLDSLPSSSSFDLESFLLPTKS